MQKYVAYMIMFRNAVTIFCTHYSVDTPIIQNGFIAGWAYFELGRVVELFGPEP